MKAINMNELNSRKKIMGCMPYFSYGDNFYYDDFENNLEPYHEGLIREKEPNITIMTPRRIINFL